MISVVLANALPFAYIGAGFLVAIIAVLWGGQAKILSASLLLASILFSNIVYSVFAFGALGTEGWTALYAAQDLALTLIFVALRRGSTFLEPAKWAGILAFIAIGMFIADLAAAIAPGLAHAGAYAWILNLLTSAALLICLIAFLPKSWDQAYGVLRIKLLYFRTDVLRRAADRRTNVLREEGNMIERREPAPSEVNAHIGWKLREARIRANMTLEGVARAVGLSTAQIQKYESGRNRVSAEALFNFARFFGRDIKFFYEGLDATPARSSPESSGERAR
ncbi:MAG: helix-turn-helix domain-containing protein [Alphaproteobacteria bacterium]|nr:helix-turn-helix domain-containing protein [Alphaproteobacteria bacterium]